MPRFRLTVAYDGSAFHGWQRQDVPLSHPLAANSREALGERYIETPPQEGEAEARVPLRTVQHVVEQSVRRVVNEPAVLMGASRTDAGVHAKAQTAAFTCSAEARRPPDDRLADAINARLPDDVLVLRCEPAGPDFDPIGDCIAKGYRYTIRDTRVRPLWDRRTVHHFRGALDERAMHDAAQRFIGTHDFTSLTTLHHGRESTVRTIFDCSVHRDDDARIMIDVSGDGFLYNMVRILAGTLVEVGRAKFAPDSIADILAAKERRAAGPTLPPEGLCLEWIRYPGDPDPGDPGLPGGPGLLGGPGLQTGADSAPTNETDAH